MIGKAPIEIFPLELWLYIAKFADLESSISLSSIHSHLHALLHGYNQKRRIHERHFLEQDLLPNPLEQSVVWQIIEPGSYHIHQDLSFKLGQFSILISATHSSLDGHGHVFHIYVTQQLSTDINQNPSVIHLVNSAHSYIANIRFVIHYYDSKHLFPFNLIILGDQTHLSLYRLPQETVDELALREAKREEQRQLRKQQRSLRQDSSREIEKRAAQARKQESRARQRR
jgi:hypothetical protein